MTNQKHTHTPGPWERGFQDNQTVYEIQRPGFRIATVYCGDSAWQANARLIAASPDLLAACEEAYKWAQRAFGVGEGEPEWPNKLFKAIAKAKGE